MCGLSIFAAAFIALIITNGGLKWLEIHTATDMSVGL